jgi:bifunctional non-homologous end joining protein LigD
LTQLLPYCALRRRAVLAGCTKQNFDGWRIQLHKDGSLMRLYTKSGYDCTKRFRVLCSALAAVPARSCIIDGEVTAFDPLGLLDFHALQFGTADDDDIAVWAFHLMFHDGRDVRELPPYHGCR